MSPLIRMSLPTVDTIVLDLLFESTIEDCNFSGLFFSQPLLSEHLFRGGLLQVDSLTANTTITLRNNTFTDIVVDARDLASDEASVIYLNGAALRAVDNKFRLIGRTHSADFDGSARTSSYLLDPKTYYDIIPITQRKGIFWMVTGSRTVTSVVSNNTFDWVFCTKGCIYSFDSATNAAHSDYTFSENTYQHIYGVQETIMSAVVASQTNHTHINETVKFV